MKRLHLVGLLVVASFFPLIFGLVTGCKGPLEPGGAYAPIVLSTNTAGVITTNVVADRGLYTADSGFVAGEAVLGLAFRFERNNRALLWKISPDIKHGLDKIRPDAEMAVQSYKSARIAYLANPTPAGLDLLNTILAKVTQYAAAAQAVINTVNTQPAK